MVNCPNCSTGMDAHPVEVFMSKNPAEVGACATCSLLWFEQSAAVRLTARSVLTLFQYIGSTTRTGTSTLASRFSCPRCRQPLQFTNDLQRTTSFTYWRCDTDHGQLISFHQFLREKNFIRSPTPAELARLRQTVRQISCSQCGAPIDLTTDSACGHCGAPVALIDPDGVARAVQALQQPGADGSLSAADDAARTALNNAHIDALFASERMREQSESSDLLVIGFGAISAILEGMLTN